MEKDCRKLNFIMHPQGQYFFSQENLLPRKISVKDRILRTFEKIQIISLGIAGLIAYGVYKLSKLLLTPSLDVQLTETVTETVARAAIKEVSTTPAFQKPVTHTILPYIGIVTFVMFSLVSTHWLVKRNL